ncbi:folate-binding protein [Lichenihabitans sp. PAMC28606]|uniref:CAF17-like 4Fe-4S cluster assembly/insertion protein YgfZ n=1 Tax=Lichenihabitans sp. PAMC28606 TaxID=2880932 RepID=UPI001D0A0F68|nr:folate-binding protein [Lichenihabitans sp. PAMC28606]UDL94942.1 folate-binding protein [Lichenihabitans sp. PAMC28606]
MSGNLAVLSDRGIVEVVGPDARDLLQRLITNDVDNLKPGEARYAALLTPQGKITSDFFVVADRDPVASRFYIDVPEALVVDLVKKLTMYRLRAKVDIRNESETLGIVAGDPSALPGDCRLTFDDPRVPGLWRRAIVDRSRFADLGDDSGRWAYREQRVRLGVPEGGIDFIYGETFPHEANLDRLHGVDFKKGCYIGQEVVSRVQHRGTARKRIVGVRFDGEPPMVGSDITADGISIGVMGSSIDGLGLGLLRIDKADDARLAGTSVVAGSTPLTLDGPGWH